MKCFTYWFILRLKSLLLPLQIRWEAVAVYPFPPQRLPQGLSCFLSASPTMPKWWQFMGTTSRSWMLPPAQISTSGQSKPCPKQCSRRRAGFLPCLRWSVKLGQNSQRKKLSRSKPRSHVLKTAFLNDSAEPSPKVLKPARGKSRSCCWVTYSLSWSTSPALGSCFLTGMQLDSSIAEEDFQYALLLLCQSHSVTAKFGGESKAGQHIMPLVLAYWCFSLPGRESCSH